MCDNVWADVCWIRYVEHKSDRIKGLFCLYYSYNKLTLSTVKKRVDRTRESEYINIKLKLPTPVGVLNLEKSIL